MNSSIPAGTVCRFGTFRTGSTTGPIIPPASNPYTPYYNTGGNLTSYAYNQTTTFLFGNSDSTPSNNLLWIKMSNTLLVADRNLLCDISWQQIYKNPNGNAQNTTQTSIIGAATGTAVVIDGHTYRVRLLTGGTQIGLVADSEWNALLALSPSNDVIHWSQCKSWCSETRSYGGNDFRPLRGFDSAGHWTNIKSNHVDAAEGFRPALELIS